MVTMMVVVDTTMRFLYSPSLKMTDGDGFDQLVDDLGKLDFHHPFTPYDVQEQFMKTVYDVLEAGNGHIGILESPTGTVSEVLYLFLSEKSVHILAAVWCFGGQPHSSSIRTELD